jgi:hypothetical protein
MVRTAAGVLAMAVAASAFGQAAPWPAPVFSKPDRIRYDQRCFYIDGKPAFIFSGAFQYFRCPRELWKDRFEKLKAAGLNTVETYLYWAYHEPEKPRGVDDFSKLQHMEEISDFVQTARDMGFNVIIRPGPYICAEVDRGGLPEWLLTEKPADWKAGTAFLRSNHPAILGWDKHWYEAVAKVLKPHLVTNLPAGQPGVILWQLENEYDLSNVQPPVRADVLHHLAQDALDAGIDVPMFVCRTTVPADDDFLKARIFDTATCYPGYTMANLVRRIGDIGAPQPERPRAVTELQGGWFAQVGGKLSEEMGYNAAQLNQLGMVCLEQGVTTINYYLVYGGSNFGRSAAQQLIQSYDYDAPIREWGGVGPRYEALAMLGNLLKEHGAALAQTTLVNVRAEGAPTDLHVTVRHADSGGTYIFVRSDKRNAPAAGSFSLPATAGGAAMTVHYDLPAYGAKILYLPPGASDETKGEWLPKPFKMPERPEMAAMPSPLPLSKPVAHPETFTNFRPIGDDATFAQLGINDTRYVCFRTHLTLTDAQMATPPILLARSAGGGLAFRINGKDVPPATGTRNIFPLAGAGKAGDNVVEILYENNGYIHHTGNLDNDKGPPDVRLLPASAMKSAISEWKMKVLTGPMRNRPEAAADFNDADFKPVSVEGGANIGTENTNAAFRATLTATDEMLKQGVRLVLGTLDDTGELYINGERVAATAELSESLSLDVTKYLKPGPNSLAVLITNTNQIGGLFNGAYVVPPGNPLTGWEIADAVAPVGDAAWAAVDAAAAPSLFLSRYRMTFAPVPDVAGAWMPWRLHLEGDANAWVSFNGHLLGQYWAVGPQRDYWLPECWLKKDGQNVIELQGRSVGNGPIIKVAEVRPVVEAAEKR